ncbi:MAG TPA: DUF6345 domain-containing protein, partial [Actinomycetota bacterium]|nr:DUF6345 domain-containing protein [Actinomycetota bacterium]
ESSGVPAFPGLEGASELLLDTQVSYNTFLDGVPVVGPGANVSVTLDAEGIVTQLQYAARGLGEGPGRPILDPASGEDVCRAALNLSSAAIVSAELVYYAPALSQDVGALLPHFACDSKQVDAAGNEAIGLTTYVPAVTDGPEASISNVSVDGGVKDGLVTASGSATGGAAGYVFSWSTTRGTIEEVSNTGTSTVTYEVVSKDPCATEVHETLILTVTDGDGLVSADQETFSVPVTPGDGCVQSSGAAERDGAGVPGATADTFGAKQMSHAVSGIQVGADGGTYSPDCTPYTTGWKNENSEGGVPSQFLYQANLAWSSDFKSDTITGGQDHEYADDVDMMFYCGHGSRGSFTFENTSGPTDKDITPGEARWGDRDIEWFALLSCQVLREDSIASGSGTWSVIWDESFNGLHGLYGFHTNASASGNLGYDMAKHMLGTDGVSAKTIHDAWVQAVNDGQPDGRIWATIYPVSTSSTWNRNDFFWGEGSVSADIPASNIYYFVRYQGTV